MNPANDDGLADRAFDALLQGEHLRALALIEQLLAAHPDDAVHLCWHSHCLLALNNPAEALISARRAVTRDDRLVQAYLPLAWSAASIGEKRQALDALARACELSGREPYILIEYANFLATEDDAVAAERVAREALEGEPESASAWAALGWAQFRQDRPAEAERSLRHARELCPDNPRAVTYLSLLLARTRRGDEAAEVAAALGDHPQAVELAGMLRDQARPAEGDGGPSAARASEDEQNDEAEEVDEVDEELLGLLLGAAPAGRPGRPPPAPPAPRHAPGWRNATRCVLWIVFWSMSAVSATLGVYDVLAGLLVFSTTVALLLAVVGALKVLSIL